jgi:hypothetical protein
MAAPPTIGPANELSRDRAVGVSVRLRTAFGSGVTLRLRAMRVPSEPRPRETRTDRDAKASLILGVLGIVASAGVFGIVFSIGALILGYRANKSAGVSHDQRRGRRIALAGIVLGWIGLAFSITASILLVSQLL